MQSVPILTINSGSSSLKLGLFVQRDGDESAIYDALVDNIGKPDTKLTVKDGTGKIVHSTALNSSTPRHALSHFTAWLSEILKDGPAAVGHRVVHGGPALTQHQPITPDVVEGLRKSRHFAPLHIPASLALIEEAEKAYPRIPQFACFDTAFHQTLPKEAAVFALPDGLFDEGVRRYGFHGLSYESILYALGKNAPDRIVIAHLGNGASLAAIEKGSSIDTTMGLTPTGGIPMGTRSGDLDPGVMIFLLRNHHLDAEALELLLNRESGLLGLSGKTADMRELQSRVEEGDAPAQLAIEVFCRSIKKAIGAFAAILGGLDLLVFTGGIGEHSARLRDSVCSGLDFLGIQLDAQQNNGHYSTISTGGSRCRVCVMPSEEDRQISRHCRILMSSGGKSGSRQSS